jgi:hypothetical protein
MFCSQQCLAEREFTERDKVNRYIQKPHGGNRRIDLWIRVEGGSRLAGRLPEEFEYRFGPQNEWDIVVANTQPLREKTFKLVYDIYLNKGYDLRLGRQSGLWYTIHHLHPYTVTFLAEKAGQPAGTVSIIPDSWLGLPADFIFPAQLSILRKAGRRLCEVFSLGVTEGIADSTIDLTMHLYRLVHLTATRLLHDTELVSSIMSHHGAFYSNILMFDEISPDSRQSPKTGEQVRFARINLETMEARYAQRYGRLSSKRNLHRWFFQNEEEPAMVEWIRRNRQPMTADELNYFGTIKSHILSESSSDTVAILMEYFREAAAVIQD